MAGWYEESAEWMRLAEKHLKSGCLSIASSALDRAGKLIPTQALTKREATAQKRFSRINDRLNKAYGC